MDNRKIDQLVAEKVMGWKVFEYKNINTTVIDDGEFLVEIEEFKPSERIEDAWNVVEKIGKDFTMNTVNEYDIHVKAGKLELIGQYHCNINGFHVYDKSAPLAICKAALKTVGVEV
ncbi:BC1872 family protein [Virgibacillus salexigens]|uniref:Phage ABA sandwich domain-containing protein n=1 Tax=Virgibacillus massiliensis TaxID=1462526 RepID=A0A024QI17_9BACI|nr:hypothetical protein [Virgibacillus massiliensis]CDQ41882.1 hypothetical protein BN990_04261 [Virgibacillus massiliensis]